MEHPEHPIGTPIGEGGVRHVEARNLGREGEHIAGLDPVRDLRNPLGGDDEP